MFQAVIIMRECATRVVWRIDEDAFDLAGEFLFEPLEGEQVVPKDKAVVEDVVVGDAVRGVV